MLCVPKKSKDMKTLQYPTSQQINEALKRPLQDDPETKQRVSQIITDVRQNGDAALYRLNREIDKYDSQSLKIERGDIENARNLVSKDLVESINLAISNIEKFHAAQKPQDVNVSTMPGVSCSIKYKPLQRVGLYIPGGTAPLLSTVLMLAVPAKVAGCKELIICTPPNPTKELLYALSLFDAKVFTVGGAQAITAMAFGTESIPKVDKIFGPGNRYVTEAKVQVSALGIPIDMPAGPSEVLVIADESANPDFIAADLLSQAEHGEDSQVVLISTSERILRESLQEIERQLSTLPRRDIAKKCLENSTAILVDNLDDAMQISNDYAPEHLILAVDNPNKLSKKVENAGSVFLGHFTPESVGDYTSGTNHTLPTSGFARNWSGVNLLSFMKTITFQELSEQGLKNLSDATTCLARAEGLEGHARAVEKRLVVGCQLSVDGNATDNRQQTTDNLIRSNISSLKPYSSARDEFEGNASVWLDANESPTSLPDLPDGINRYPASQLKELKEKISEVKRVNTQQVFIGNGSDEAVDLLFRIFCNPGVDKALVFTPTYGMYGVCAAVNDVRVIESPMDEDFNINLNRFDEANSQYPKLTFICNPNNPSANTQAEETIRYIIEKSKGIVVVDEAYIDYCFEKSVIKWVDKYPNLVVLQTLSKAWGLAAARVGLAFASQEIIGFMNKVKFPYNVGKPSIDITLKALEMENEMKEKVKETLKNREYLSSELSKFKMVTKVFPSDSNFLLAKFTEPKKVYKDLANNGIVVRDRSTQPGCVGCLRITVGTMEEVEKLIDTLKQV